VKRIGINADRTELPPGNLLVRRRTGVKGSSASRIRARLARLFRPDSRFRLRRQLPDIVSDRVASWWYPWALLMGFASLAPAGLGRILDRRVTYGAVVVL
jgi:hypothetical protein